MNQHQNIIVEEYDSRAIYQLKTLPTHGDLLLNGVVMKVGDKFNQGHVRAGTFQYKHTKNEGDVSSAKDSFRYTIPINDTTNLTDTTPRSPCLPAAGVPKDGIYTFPISIVVLPFPKEIRNKELKIMEDETKCLNRSMLFYSSNTAEINQYFGKPTAPISPSESAIFSSWKRFSGNKVYENAGEGAPESSDAKRWEFDAVDDSIQITNNSASYTGLVSLTQSENLKMAATMSSVSGDDDLISIVIAYAEVGGVPQTLTLCRSGGFNGKTPATVQTWLLVLTSGETRTVLGNKSSSAPNGFVNAKSQGWNKLGKTRVEITRKGNVIEAKCSQFSFTDPTTGLDNDVLPIDDATVIVFNITPGSVFDGPAQYGFGALSQQYAKFEDMEFVELPPEVVPPVPDPPTDPLWEKFPITYTVSYTSEQKKATILLNGVKMKPGDTFTHADMDKGLLCVTGTFTGAGEEYFGFVACANEFKCKSGRFNIKVVEWPYPETENNDVTIDECSEHILTEDDLKFTVEFGSTDDQISIVFDPDRTTEINGPNTKVTITPTSFTQADINAGLVKIKHNCSNSDTMFFERLMFNVCTQHGKCVERSLGVHIEKLPVDPPVLPPTVIVSENGCVYKLNFYGVWQLIGTCGLWTELLGRIVPDPTTPGEVLHLPNGDGKDEPVTLVTIINDKGELEWVKLPYQIPEQPQGDECSTLPIAPETSRDNSVADIVLWGTRDENDPPKFDFYVGTQLIASDVVGDMKTVGQTGSQAFKFVFDSALLDQFNTIRVEFTNDDWIKYDRNLTVISMAINGTPASNYRRGGNLATNVVVPATVYSQGDSIVASGNWAAPPYITTEPPGTCFIGPDGTKYVADVVGEWKPVCDPNVPGSCNILTANLDPIILTGDYLIQVDDLTKTPLTDKPLYVKKPVDTVFTQQPDETYVAEETPYTQTYKADEFNWIGPNEFWLAFGEAFDLYFFSSRRYVRFDVIADNGNSLIDPIQFIGTQNYPNPFIGNTPFTTMGQFPRKPAQTVYPMRTIFDGGNPDTVANMNPLQKGQYYVKLGGSSSYAGFVTPQKAVGVPALYSGPMTSGGPSTAFPREYFLGLNGGEIWSYSGFSTTLGGGLLQARGPSDEYSTNKVNGYLGPAYGSFDADLHFNSFKRYGNTNYSPPKQYKGWMNGQLSFISNEMIKPSFNTKNGGAYDGTPPKAAKTMTFNVRGVDLVTGEIKNRTYKVHWSSTGVSSDGKRSKITDVNTSTPPSFLPPKPKTAVCFFLGNGQPGNCKFL